MLICIIPLINVKAELFQKHANLIIGASFLINGDTFEWDDVTTHTS